MNRRQFLMAAAIFPVAGLQPESVQASPKPECVGRCRWDVGAKLMQLLHASIRNKFDADKAERLSNVRVRQRYISGGRIAFDVFATCHKTGVPDYDIGMSWDTRASLLNASPDDIRRILRILKKSVELITR